MLVNQSFINLYSTFGPMANTRINHNGLFSSIWKPLCSQKHKHELIFESYLILIELP